MIMLNWMDSIQSYQIKLQEHDIMCIIALEHMNSRFSGYCHSSKAVVCVQILGSQRMWINIDVSSNLKSYEFLYWDINLKLVIFPSFKQRNGKRQVEIREQNLRFPFTCTKSSNYNLPYKTISSGDNSVHLEFNPVTQACIYSESQTKVSIFHINKHITNC
jgi:hypothetical protein